MKSTRPFSNGTRNRSSLWKWIFSLTGLLVLLCALAWPRVSVALRADGLTATWARARQAGVYQFTADIRQTSTPQATVRNVGRATKTSRLHLEGDTNLPDRHLQLTLWSQGGSVLDASSGVEIKVEGDHAYARQGAQDWQEINNFMDTFAPQGDFMAYLAAAQDVQPGIDPDTGNTHYTFRIDGHAYAVYLRDQMEQHLAQAGQLPPGVSLDLPKSYQDMRGDGELWVDAAGLPQRQVLRLHFPPRPEAQAVQAEVTVDFHFPQPQAGISGGFSALGLDGRAPRDLGRVAYQWGMFALLLVLAVWIVVYRRSRRLYAALALALILSMVASPFLQSARAAQFAAEQTAQAQAAEARQQESDMQRTLQTILTTSDHQPNINPLAALDGSALAANVPSMNSGQVPSTSSGQVPSTSGSASSPRCSG